MNLGLCVCNVMYVVSVMIEVDPVSQVSSVNSDLHSCVYPFVREIKMAIVIYHGEICELFRIFL